MKKLSLIVLFMVILFSLFSCKKEQYSVSFNLNGGEMSVTSSEVYYNQSYVLPTPNKFGSEFAGWYIGETRIENFGTWKIQENVTLDAKWNEVDITGSDGFIYRYRDNALMIKDYVGDIGDHVYIPTEVLGYKVNGILNGAFDRVSQKLKTEKESAFKVYLTRGILKIESDAFSDENIAPVVWDFKDESGIIYRDEGTYLSVVGFDGKCEQKIQIPYEHNGKPVTQIAPFAFYNLQNLIPENTISAVNFRVSIPKSVNFVGKKAFYVCGGVTPTLYYLKDDSTYREITDRSVVLEWVNNATFESGNKDVTDVLMILRPAIGWTRFSGVKPPQGYVPKGIE